MNYSLRLLETELAIILYRLRFHVTRVPADAPTYDEIINKIVHQMAHQEQL